MTTDNAFVATTGGLVVQSNNVNVAVQKDPFGNFSNVAFYDSQDTFFVGPTDGRISTMTLSPINLFKRHIVWDFNEAALPPGLNYYGIGNGAVLSYTGDSKVSITARGVAAGDGGLLVANNILTTLARRTNIYFVLDLNGEDRNTDLQFGLRSSDASSQTRFRYAAAANAHSNLLATIQNSSDYPRTMTLPFDNIADRHVFMIQWLPNDAINFYYGDSQNVLQLGASFTANDAARPGRDTNLVPFVQLRTYDSETPRTVNIDTIYSVFEW